MNLIGQPPDSHNKGDAHLPCDHGGMGQHTAPFDNDGFCHGEQDGPSGIGPLGHQDLSLPERILRILDITDGAFGDLSSACHTSEHAFLRRCFLLAVDREHVLPAEISIEVHPLEGLFLLVFAVFFFSRIDTSSDIFGQGTLNHSRDLIFFQIEDVPVMIDASFLFKIPSNSKEYISDDIVDIGPSQTEPFPVSDKEFGDPNEHPDFRPFQRSVALVDLLFTILFDGNALSEGLCRIHRQIIFDRLEQE